MSLQPNPTAATADDLQEAMRAILIMVSLIIDQLEEGERIERGHFSRILSLIDEMTLQKAVGDHPDGRERLALGLLRELQNTCDPAPAAAKAPVRSWTPTLLQGGKD